MIFGISVLLIIGLAICLSIRNRCVFYYDWRDLMFNILPFPLLAASFLLQNRYYLLIPVGIIMTRNMIATIYHNRFSVMYGIILSIIKPCYSAILTFFVIRIIKSDSSDKLQSITLGALFVWLTYKLINGPETMENRGFTYNPDKRNHITKYLD